MPAYTPPPLKGGRGTGGDGRIHVLWLIKGLGRGGAEALLVAHARAGDAGFHYSVAYAVAEKTALVRDLTAAGVSVHHLGSRHWSLALVRLLWSTDADVVHTHSPLLAAMARAVVRLRGSGRPALMYTEHNRWGKHRRATRWFNRLTYPLDDAQIAVSHGVRESLPTGQRSGVEVLVHGIDREATRAAADRDGARWELDVPTDEIVIGVVANLRPEKGYPLLVKAAERVVESQPRLRFIGVGVGPEEERVRSLIRERGLEGRFALLGFREDAVRIMSAFDIFCLSSFHEGLPVALMEAMTLGLPIVATAVGGIPEAIHDGVEGRLVPPDNPNALASGLLEAIDDPGLRARWGAAAQERSEMFESSRAVGRLEELYRHLAGRTGSQ